MALTLTCEVAFQRMIHLLTEFTKQILEFSQAILIDSVDVSPALMELVLCLNVFKDSVEAEMRTTATAKRRNEVNFRATKEKLIKNLEEIKGLELLLKEERSKFVAFREQITADIAAEMSILSAQPKQEVFVSQEDHYLEGEINIAESKLDALVERVRSIKRKNMKHEEYFHRCRSEAERRYAKLLAKYDRDIGAQYHLKEKLGEQRRMLMKEHEELRLRLSVQHELYVRLKAEKEESIRKAFAEKLENFKRNRAARVIQRSWRSYRERLMLKKKKKVKKKYALQH